MLLFLLAVNMCNSVFMRVWPSCSSLSRFCLREHCELIKRSTFQRSLYFEKPWKADTSFSDMKLLKIDQTYSFPAQWWNNSKSPSFVEGSRQIAYNRLALRLAKQPWNKGKPSHPASSINEPALYGPQALKVLSATVMKHHKPM